MERLKAGLEHARREGGVAEATAPAAAPDRGIAVDHGSTAETDAAVAGCPVEWGISPHAPYTVSARLYGEVARFARRRGLRLATHLAESQAEVKLLAGGRSAISRAYKAAHLWSGQHWTPPGVSPVRHVAATGALGPDTLVVHAVHTRPADIATLAASGAAVAHCPRSNLRLQCGMAPVAEMLSAGVTVGLGTDGLCSNDDLDMFAEMRAALEVSEVRAATPARNVTTSADASVDVPAAATPPASLTPATVLRMATLEGARALGWDELVGSLEPGKRADIIAVRLPGAASGAGAAVSAPREAAPHPATPSLDPVALVVGAATAADVVMAMVDGAVVWESRPSAADQACAAAGPPGGALLGGPAPPAPPVAVTQAFAAIRAKLGLAG
jgi:5-methylthioadenosine/S-adenosylhomocysteine deaminase